MLTYKFWSTLMFVYHNLETINGKHNGGKSLQNRAQGETCFSECFCFKIPFGNEFFIEISWSEITNKCVYIAHSVRTESSHWFGETCTDDKSFDLCLESWLLRLFIKACPSVYRKLVGTEVGAQC